MHRPRLRRACAALCATVLLAPLSACGGDSGAQQSAPPPTVAASSTTTPSRGARPDPPTAGADTKQARSAFLGYVVQAYQYAVRTNDAQPITAVAATEKAVACAICRNFAAQSEKLRAQGRSVPDVDLAVTKVYFGKKLPHGVLEYIVVTRSKQAHERDRSGATVRTYPAKERFVFDVGFRWNDGRYELTGFQADA